MNRARSENGTSPIQDAIGPTGLPASHPTAEAQARAARSRADDEDGPKARVIAINRYYAPDHSATAQLLTDLCEHLAAPVRDRAGGRAGDRVGGKEGNDGTPVTVITSRLRYDDPTATLPAQETINGVHVRRVWTTRFGRAGLWGRAIDYLTFYLTATLALLLLARPGDTILAKTDPPLISVPVALVCRLRRARLVNWCQDLFPEIAASVGLRWAGGPLGRLLRRLRNRSLARSAMNVVLCRSMQAHLMAEGVPAARLHVVHNWVADDIEPLPGTRPGTHQASLPGEAAPAAPFTICYSGNLGRVHDVDAIIDLIRRTADLAGPDNLAGSETCPNLAARVRNEPAMDDPRTGGQGEKRAKVTEQGDADAEPPPRVSEERSGSRTSDEAPGCAGPVSGMVSGASATASAGLAFRFVGGGVGQARLKAAIAAHGWSHVTFEPYAPLAELGRSLAACDAHLVSLDPACEGLIQPSKIYGVLAAGRPTLFLGAGDGALARLLERHGAGFTLDISAPDTWRPLLASLIADPVSLAAMGQNARRAHEHHYARRLALAAWREVLAPAPAALPVATPEPVPARITGPAPAEAYASAPVRAGKRTAA